MQNNYMELQMMNNELQQLQQKLQAAEKQIADLTRLEETITDFSNTKPGSETLVPLGNGLFAKAELKDNKELIMAVGASVSVTKSIEEAKKVVAEQASEMEKIAAEIESAISHTTAHMYELQQELQNSQKQSE